MNYSKIYQNVAVLLFISTTTFTFQSKAYAQNLTFTKVGVNSQSNINNNTQNHQAITNVNEEYINKPDEIELVMKKVQSKNTGKERVYAKIKPSVQEQKNYEVLDAEHDEIAQLVLNKLPDHDNISINPQALSKNEKRYYEGLNNTVKTLVLPNSKDGLDIFADNHHKSQFIRPVSYQHKINSKYGMRVHPVLGGKRMHTGVDFAAPTGTPIYAAQSGKVIFSDWKGGYGKTVIVKHDNKYSSLYGHASKLLVSNGEYVQRGQKIALVGSTGRSTGPHLHFEIFENGNRINPEHKIF